MKPSPTVEQSEASLQVPIYIVKPILVLLVAAALMLLTMRWNHVPVLLPFMLITACPFMRYVMPRGLEHRVIQPL